MLNNTIKQANVLDTKELAEILSEREFLRSVDSDKKKYKNYLADLVSGSFWWSDQEVVTLPKEIIPDDVTWNAFAFTYEKDPSTLPILLRYFTHKSLLKEAKDDLDRINQELQIHHIMNEDINEYLENLQKERRNLQSDKTHLSYVKMHDEGAKALAVDRINEKITKTSSEIEEIKQYKEEIKNPLIEIMEKKLIAYVNGDTNIKKVYQSLNSKAKKIFISKNIKIALQVSSFPFFFTVFMFLIPFFVQSCAGPSEIHYFALNFLTHYSLPILLPIVVTLFVMAGVAYKMQRHYEQSFVKEMQDFIEGPKYIDKTTNTEDEKELESKEEPKTGDLIDLSDNHKIEDEVKPLTPPYDSEQSEDPSGKLSAQSNGSIYPILHVGISYV